jgi:hypothetical protein
MNRLILTAFVLTCSCIVAVELQAHGPVVDKVYHPYVLPNEREFEWRLTSRDNNGADVLAQRLGFGHAISEYITIEGYVTGRRDDSTAFQLHSYELEARWMLTEQGKYWADWGMLVELEKEHEHDHWEISTAALFEKELGRTSLTLNLFALFEWGEDIENEWEGEFRLKYRYRWLPQIQPALEVYVGEDLAGVGPAFMGIQRLHGQKQLKWEAGFIFELSNDGRDRTFRMALEYEF